MKQQGFTLVEMMVVVAIIGLIATIGYPSYVEQMKKSRRADAKVTLVSLAQVQESIYADNNSYTATLDTSGLGCVNRGLCVIDSSVIYTPEKYYVLSATGTARAYTLTATVSATGSQKTDDECNVLTLNHKNQKTAVDSSAADSSDACW